MNKESRTVTINGQKHWVWPGLDNFVIYETPGSSNTTLFAVNTIERKLFVRFKNGGQYMYSNVPDKVIVHAPNVPSITKFINTYIKPNKEITTTRDEGMYFSNWDPQHYKSVSDSAADEPI